MNRRKFLSVSGAVLASLFCPKICLGQSKNKTAIVIGVNKSGKLPVLNAAASGAAKFADWLAGEGFEVNQFIDGPNKKIKVDPIFEKVDKIITRGICEQLVIYFSGHGFLNGYSELWMLSDAPNNPNQAISLKECKNLCKRSGIPNVVFISDACRSTATSLAAQAVRGSLIFPTGSNSGNIKTKVDTFLATQEGNPAYEVNVDVSEGNYQGIYTESFLSAYRSPEDEMVSKVDGIEVILNRDLEDYLSRDVNRRAQLASIALEQRPESEVLSNKHIGRVRRSGQRPSLPKSEVTIAEATALAFNEKGFQNMGIQNPMNIMIVKSSIKAKTLADAKQQIADAEKDAPKSFETETGFFVSGADVSDVIINQDFYWAEIATNKTPGSIRLHPKRREPASAVIRFSDGSGTVIAALKGYIGTVVVDDGRVVSVTYTRSQRGLSGSSEERRLLELRRLVATSARFGTFKIGVLGRDREKQAEKLADRIRVLKMVDPTLGIYAAYAYADADLPHQIESVRFYMQHDINGQIFDVALLADKLPNLPSRDIGIAPFCPMLSQGWGLLRIANVQLHPDIDMARDHMVQALWTTFDEKGMDLVINAMMKGWVI